MALTVSCSPRQARAQYMAVPCRQSQAIDSAVHRTALTGPRAGKLVLIGLLPWQSLWQLDRLLLRQYLACAFGSSWQLLRMVLASHLDS